MYRGWTQTDYQNKHYNINQKDEGTWEDRGRDGGTNFILRFKEQEIRLTLQEHDDDDDDDKKDILSAQHQFGVRRTISLTAPPRILAARMENYGRIPSCV